MVQNKKIFFPYSYFTESGSFDDEPHSGSFETEIRVIKSLCLERQSEQHERWLETDKFLFNYFNSDVAKVLFLLKQIMNMNEDLNTLQWNYMLRRFKMYFIVLFLQSIWKLRAEPSITHDCSDYCLDPTTK